MTLVINYALIMIIIFTYLFYSYESSNLNISSYIVIADDAAFICDNYKKKVI